LPAPDTQADLELLESAVVEAGAIARSFFGGEYKRWDKGKGNPVTEADLAVDRFLNEKLRGARPGYGWLSEETDDNPARLDTRTLFVVDPIDGTVAFLKNLPDFTICAAVVHDERPVAGVVFNPISEHLYSARLGGGAFRNGVPIHPSERHELESSRMLASKSMLTHPAWDRPPNRPWPPVETETLGSIAYRIVLVAQGEFDAMMALSSKRDWDLAAADLILHEAGGMLTAHDGSVFRYNRADAVQKSVVGAGPALHAQLIERLAHLTLPRQQVQR